MNRRILFILVGAMVLIALVAGLWIWFLNRPAPAPSSSGTFGTASSTSPGSLSGGGTGGNISGNVPGSGSSAASGGGNLSGNTSVGGVINPAAGQQPGAGGTPGGTLPPGSAPPPGTDLTGGNGGAGSAFTAQTGQNFIPPGVQWLGAGGTPGGSIGGGLGSDFTPTSINQLNDGTVDGVPTIFGNTVTAGSQNGSGIGLGGALIGAAAGTALCTAGLLGGVAVGGSAGAAGIGGTAAQTITSVPVNDINLNLQVAYGNTLKSNDTFKANFLDCVTRTIAKAALQQITASVVNWINSGFNGNPSFVTNYQQFFQNVADQAAGEYIKGSALSFLCSPFQLQVKIAIAQSYANRNNGGSCSLSKVVGNINSFMSGNFSQGGWPGLLKITTVPTNNPYGALAYAQIGLATAQSNAYANANRNMTATGFLNFQQPYDCKSASAPSTGDTAGQPVTYGCKYKTVTPGSVIESSLNSTLGTSARTLEQAGVSGSFDAIINALISQLMTRTLYSGLSNISGNAGYQSNFLTPEQQQAQNQARAIMTQLQSDVSAAQQYGQSEQGSIQDIQNTQQKLNTLYNCWVGWVGGSLTPSKQAFASTSAQAASSTLLQLNGQVDAHNNNILRANTAIVILQSLQTRALNVASLADVAALMSDYNSAEASGQIIAASDVTFSQQDRATIQAQLASINTATSAGLTQCYAFGS